MSKKWLAVWVFGLLLCLGFFEMHSWLFFTYLGISIAGYAFVRIKYPERFTKEAKAERKALAEQQRVEKLSQSEKGRTKLRVEENKRSGVACCPKCGSTSLSSNKKGYGIGKGVIGGCLFGLIGLIFGNIGAKKIRVTCLNCGHQWFA